MSKWIEEVFEILPDGDYDSDDIAKILGRVDSLLRTAANSVDSSILYDKIMEEIQEIENEID